MHFIGILIYSHMTHVVHGEFKKIVKYFEAFFEWLQSDFLWGRVYSWECKWLHLDFKRLHGEDNVFTLIARESRLWFLVAGDVKIFGAWLSRGECVCCV